ncbi:MAG: MFS transporter [Caldisphaera sp.]|nr:MAG: MFS transporter [Caldisphaera sp.]
MSNPFKSLDEKKLSWFHFKSLITTGMGVFTDGYDLSSIGIVLLSVLSSFGINSKNPNYVLYVSLISGAALMGAAVGAIIFGILSNKGRKTFYGVDVAILTIGALLQAFVKSPEELIIARLILGIGVGADYVLSPIIMTEHSNAKDRGKILALGFGLMWGFGATTAAIIYLTLSYLGLNSMLIWKIVLAAGAIPAASVIYLRRKIPETARFLGRIKGDVKGFKEVISEVTGSSININSNLKDEKSSFYYFKKYWRYFSAAALIWFLYDIVVYAGVMFGPSLIASKLGLNSGTFQIVNEALFVIPGGLIALGLIDKVGRKPLQIYGYIGMAVFLLGFAIYEHLTGSSHGFSPLLALLLYGGYNLANQAGPGSISGTGIFAVELAPTKVRGTVQSIAVASGRIGATLTSFVFPALFVKYGQFFAVGFLSTTAILAAIVTLVLVPETKAKPLEEITKEVEEMNILSKEFGGIIKE